MMQTEFNFTIDPLSGVMNLIMPQEFTLGEEADYLHVGKDYLRVRKVACTEVYHVQYFGASDLANA
jgi:hypothetical protein